MAKTHDEKGQNRSLVFATVSFYLVAALAMVMANKWVLNTTDAPLFFLFTQLLIAVVLFVAVNAFGLMQVPTELDPVIVKQMGPMVGLNVVGLSFSNYTLKYVDASFYQVARGLVLPFTVLTSLLVLHSRPSTLASFACAVVTAGFFVGVFLDGTPISGTGIFFGVASSAITATHSVVIKRSLAAVQGSALKLSWYNNLLSAAILAPLIILAGEGPSVWNLLFGPDTSGKLLTFVWGSLITGVFGFLMSIASLLSIKVTSPITHMVSSAVRGVAASFLGVWLFHDVITTGRAASIATILAGSIWYTWVKHNESLAPAPPQHTRGVSYDRVPMEEMENGRASGPQTKAE
ncbi:hypothetical protein PUNSTDRAFT_140740 [Punctularia strigosozonata HHB-11173 SS5]|uniref:uncharacterized protein n=1 Tax=Punctularia strigosozonata (strain HHB-11173) TaxID=741275 RepID=UPI0004416F34|nr:uncharacterized protein PUNSTDRAFT_140740 [Punctularia strigosozonata HHB-11173 SS5]EIN14450.1 hypothetical protein PUNSTDRAFT_140740 [Punctularia strigosozonata HHB-11173 SS5]